MTFVFPTRLVFSVERVAATMSVYTVGDKPNSVERFSLVLRATRDTNILLITGQRLSEVDIDFTLSATWRTPQELDHSLTIKDVGFLVHTQGESGEPSVHGSCLLTSTTVVSSLLSAGVSGKLQLEIPTVPSRSRDAAPYVWGVNRPNMLSISHLEVTSLRSAAAPGDS